MSKLVFVLLMGIFLGSVESRAAEKIRISVSGGYNMIFLSSGVAQHRGFFRDEGLDADIIVMGAGAVHRGAHQRRHRLHLVDRHGNPRGDPRIAGAFGRRLDDQFAPRASGPPGDQIRQRAQRQKGWARRVR